MGEVNIKRLPLWAALSLLCACASVKTVPNLPGEIERPWETLTAACHTDKSTARVVCDPDGFARAGRETILNAKTLELAIAEIERSGLLSDIDRAELRSEVDSLQSGRVGLVLISTSVGVALGFLAGIFLASK